MKSTEYELQIAKLEALCDLNYAAGVRAGWNCEDHEQRDKMIEARRGPALRLLKELKRPSQRGA